MKKILIIFIVILIPLLAWARSSEDIAQRKQFRLASKAVTSNNMKLLKGMVSDGMDIRIKNLRGKTLLMSACGDSNPSLVMVKHLVVEGVDIDAVSGAGYNAISIAMKKGNADIIRFLLDNGADWRQADRANIINVSDLELVKYFIDDGVDIDTQDKSGITALIRSVINDNIGIVEYLLEVGSDRYIRDKVGKTARDYAIELNRPDMVRMLSRDL